MKEPWEMADDVKKTVPQECGNLLDGIILWANNGATAEWEQLRPS